MNTLDAELGEQLRQLRANGLYRQLRRIDSAQSPRLHIGGMEVLNFSSNDYLGLANHPLLKQAAIEATETYGVGGGASRLICGSLGPHHELELAIAQFKGAEAALSFSTGYAAALGTICALVARDDIIILDKLVHASIVDAARLSGAKLRVFRHNDLSELDDILKWADGKRRTNLNPPANRSRILIVTESVFSMDGDRAPLTEIVGLKNRYGTWLMVDEAHATGIFGPSRRGLSEELGIADQVEIHLGTLGKAIGASGGYICGSRTLIEYLVNRARSFIFSTAPVPAAAAAATAGIRFVQSEEGARRCNLLWQRIAELRELKGQCSASLRPTARTGQSEGPGGTAAVRNGGPIIPIIIGDEATAVQAAAALLERKILLPAIRYPTVARGSARLRLTLSAAHTREDIERLTGALLGLEHVLKKAPAR